MPSTDLASLVETVPALRPVVAELTRGDESPAAVAVGGVVRPRRPAPLEAPQQGHVRHPRHVPRPQLAPTSLRLTRFGHFDDVAREYVIGQPDTPLPWINYLGSEDYFGIITNTAGGYSFYRDARLRRLTRYRYNGVPLDGGGRYLYVRDADTAQFWSPSWQPTRADLEDYRCRHGLGYTVIGSRRDGVEVETTYFVPLGETLEIWRATVTNHRPSPARLSLFSAIEFCLWEAWDDATNFQRNFSTGEVEVDAGVIYHTTEYRERRNHFAFFACSEPLAGFDTQREAFLGPYRGWDPWSSSGVGRRTRWPTGGRRAGRTTSPSSSDPVRAAGRRLRPRLRREPAGGEVLPARVRNARHARCAPAHRPLPPHRRGRRHGPRLAEHWEQLLSILQIDTPDPHANRMINVWNAYQCMATFNLSRSASLFESGLGRGMGFRDSNQDLLGFVHMVPAPGAGADPRHRRDPAAHRRRLSPVPAVDEAGERRRRVGVQR